MVAERGYRSNGCSCSGRFEFTTCWRPPSDVKHGSRPGRVVELDMTRFMELCQAAYQDGDFSYVKTMLQANSEGIGAFITTTRTSPTRKCSTL